MSEINEINEKNENSENNVENNVKEENIQNTESTENKKFGNVSDEDIKLASEAAPEDLKEKPKIMQI